jgi:hypothetical protein
MAEGSQILGGIAVEIGANLAGLKIGVKESKTIAATAEKEIAIKVPVVIDKPKVVAAVKELQATVLRASHDLTVRIPVMFDTRGLGDISKLRIGNPQFNQFIGSPSSEPLSAIGNRYFPQAPPRGAARGRTPFRSPDPADLEALLPGAIDESQPYNTSRRRGGGGGAAAAQSAGFNIGKFNPFSNRGLERALGSAFAGYLVSEGLKITGEVTRAIGQTRSGNIITQQQGRLGLIQAGQGVPFVGSLVSSVDAFQASGTRVPFLAPYGGRNTAVEAIQANIDDQLRAQAAVGTTRVRLRAAGAARATLRGDEAGAIAQTAEGQIIEAKQDVLAGGGGGAVQAVEEVRKLRDEQVADMRLRRRESQAAASAGNTAALIGIQASRASIAGNGQQAFQLGQQASRQQLVAGGQNRLIGVRNPEDRAQIIGSNAIELKAFDENAAREAGQRQRSIAADTASAISSRQEATLRTSKQGYAADLKAFDDAAKRKLSLITDLTEKQNEATRVSAQRSVLVFQQTQQQQQQVAGYQATATVATLQAQRQGYRATLKGFDLDTKQILENSDASTRDAISRARAQQRAAIVTEQNQGRGQLRIGLRERRESAAASAEGKEQLAGIIGTIAGFHREREGADRQDLPEIVNTQKSVLQSLERGILRPRRFATEGAGQFAEVPGGPSGRGGSSEIPDILKEIRDELKRIGPGGLG